MEQFEFNLYRKGGNASLKKGNQMLSANDRMHPMVKAGITAHLRQLGYEAVGDFVGEPYSPERTCQVTVKIAAPSRRKMDDPNWYPTVKALLDGMTDAGLWTDDNNTVIKRTIFENDGLSEDKTRYRLTIQIEETT